MPAPVANELKEYGIREKDIIPARSGQELNLGTVTVKAIPSAHEQLNCDDNGDFFEMGYRFQFNDCVVYHAGDCCIYDGLVEYLGHVDIAMLPVNGRDYFRSKHDIIGNMTAAEAVELAENIQAILLIPMHFDLYDCNCISATAFIDAHESAGAKVPYHIFQPGEKYIFG